MKIGFLLLSHNFSEHYIALINKLLNVNKSSICIHHDFSQSILPQFIPRGDRVFVMENWRVTKWSHISCYFATVDGFLQLRSLKSPPDWYINLSANDYLIKPPEFILDFFSTTPYDSFVEQTVVDGKGEGYLRFWGDLLFKKKIFSLPFPTKNFGFQMKPIKTLRSMDAIRDFGINKFYVGSDWLCLHRSVLDQLLALDLYQNPFVKFVEEVNKDGVGCPTEIIWHSLVGNLCNANNHPNNLRFIDWTGSKDWHPNTLTLGDWPKIKQSPALFARKFDPKMSKFLVEKIDSELLCR
jgi:hypothetical protein